ncbi:unnamed protein product [Pleuronectes platessa]|uniref:Uncharacterized protein n=1 Tax=Pleuronectes platessa TaxID=8262 RepID=A0A9N7Z5C2_PLEPL|nr:unnamed protein product [Pleuronectes platessa]
MGSLISEHQRHEGRASPSSSTDAERRVVSLDESAGLQQASPPPPPLSPPLPPSRPRSLPPSSLQPPAQSPAQLEGQSPPTPRTPHQPLPPLELAIGFLPCLSALGLTPPASPSHPQPLGVNTFALRLARSPRRHTPASAWCLAEKRRL